MTINKSFAWTVAGWTCAGMVGLGLGFSARSLDSGVATLTGLKPTPAGVVDGGQVENVNPMAREVFQEAFTQAFAPPPAGLPNEWTNGAQELPQVAAGFQNPANPQASGIIATGHHQVSGPANMLQKNARNGAVAILPYGEQPQVQVNSPVSLPQGEQPQVQAVSPASPCQPASRVMTITTGVGSNGAAGLTGQVSLQPIQGQVVCAPQAVFHGHPVQGQVVCAPQAVFHGHPVQGQVVCAPQAVFHVQGNCQGQPACCLPSAGDRMATSVIQFCPATPQDFVASGTAMTPRSIRTVEWSQYDKNGAMIPHFIRTVGPNGFQRIGVDCERIGVDFDLNLQARRPALGAPSYLAGSPVELTGWAYEGVDGPQSAGGANGTAKVSPSGPGKSCPSGAGDSCDKDTPGTLGANEEPDPLVGSFPSEMDAGSLILPEALAGWLTQGKLYVAPGPDGCLRLGSLEMLESLFFAENQQAVSVVNLPDQVRGDKAQGGNPDLSRRLMRRFYGQMTLCLPEEDEDGSLLIPVSDSLIAAAGLKGEVVIVGMRTHAEIWSRSAWEAEVQGTEPKPQPKKLASVPTR